MIFFLKREFRVKAGRYRRLQKLCIKEPEKLANTGLKLLKKEKYFNNEEILHVETVFGNYICSVKKGQRYLCASIVFTYILSK